MKTLPETKMNKLKTVRNIGGSSDDKAASSLSHAEVIKQYKEVDQLPAEERNTVIKVVSALLRDYKTRQAYAS